MDLTAEQQQLLVTFVEEWRALPGDRRSAFLLLPFDGLGSKYYIRLPNPSQFQVTAYGGDVDTLVEAGLLRAKRDSKGELRWLDLTGPAFDAYRAIKEREGRSTERRESYVRRYLDSEWMRTAYGAALAKLDEADDLLWSDLEQERSPTTIGHLCREAMQLFAGELVDQLGLSGAEPDPQKTKNRVRIALERLRPSLGYTAAGLLAALWEYSSALNDVVQKQEHGSRVAERRLEWDDARRAVFHAGIVIVEIANVMRRATERTADPSRG